ncbi:hypothetical protein MASR1M32_36280 [Rhodobacter sp.]
MRIALIILAVAAGLYLAAVAAMFAFQRQFQYFPTNRAPSPADAEFEGAAEHVLTAEDGTRILLWYAPAPEGAPTILYFQGNGGEIADRADRWAAYRDAGFGTAFLSYRGYGGSEGRPTEAGLHQDAAAALAFLGAQGVGPGSIALVGESLGTGVAVRLAADQPQDAPFAAAGAGGPLHLDRRCGGADLPLAAGAASDAGSIPLHRPDRPDQCAPLRLSRRSGPDDPVRPWSGTFRSCRRTEGVLSRPGRGHEAIYDPATWQQEAGFIWGAYLRP